MSQSRVRGNDDLRDGRRISHTLFKHKFKENGRKIIDDSLSMKTSYYKDVLLLFGVY
jgi:hypothetical protein